MTTLKDIAGNTIEPGDTVVYPQMSGRSVQMVLGKFLSYEGGKAQIERLEGSRWSASYSGTTRYRDKRTGKGIDPYAPSGKHYSVPPRGYYKHRETGEEISEEEFRTRYPDRYSGWHSYSRDDRSRWQGRCEPGVLHDYVEEYKAGPKPVTILNVGNIIKVEAKE